jgi:hypothetical protein
MAVGMGMAAGKPAADHRGQGLGVQPGKGCGGSWSRWGPPSGR